MAVIKFSLNCNDDRGRCKGFFSYLAVENNIIELAKQESMGLKIENRSISFLFKTHELFVPCTSYQHGVPNLTWDSFLVSKGLMAHIINEMRSAGWECAMGKLFDKWQMKKIIEDNDIN